MTFRKIIRYWAYFLLIIGGLGFGGGYLASNGFLDGIMHEFPLAPTSLAVDKNENIYVALEFYGMVQVYNQNGRFKTSFRIPNARGREFRMQTKANGNLSVAVKKTLEIYTFNADGEQVKKLENQVLVYEKYPENQEINLPNGTKYLISSAVFYPEILRQKNDKTEIIISIPDHLKFVKGAFPAWLFWVFGVILLAMSTGDVAKKMFQTRPAEVKIKQTKTQTHITISQNMEGHFGETAMLVFFTALWIYGGYLALNHAFLKDFSPFRTFFYVFLGAIWVLGLRQILVGILWLLSGKEVILINTKKLEISREALFINKNKSFPPDAVFDIFADSANTKDKTQTASGFGKGQISFRYQKRRYRFGKNLTDKDLKLVLMTLKKSKPLKADKFKPRKKPSFAKQFLNYMTNPKK